MQFQYWEQESYLYVTGIFSQWGGLDGVDLNISFLFKEKPAQNIRFDRIVYTFLNTRY